MSVTTRRREPTTPGEILREEFLVPLRVELLRDTDDQPLPDRVLTAASPGAFSGRRPLPVRCRSGAGG